MKKLVVFFILLKFIFANEVNYQRQNFYLTDLNRMESFSPLNNENVKISYTIFYNKNKQDKKRPLIIYNHGLFSRKFDNITLFNSLVARGYVVVAIDHKYLTSIFIDENNIITRPDYNQLSTINLPRYASTLAKDSLLVLDKLKTINELELNNLIDTDKYIAMGWSIGGAISGILLNTDERCIGAINFDGTNVGKEPSFKYEKPFLIYVATGTPVEVRKDIFDIRNMSHGKTDYLVFNKTNHLDFSFDGKSKKEFFSTFLNVSGEFADKVYNQKNYKEYLLKIAENKDIYLNEIPKDHSGIILLSILGICVLGFGIKKFKK